MHDFLNYKFAVVNKPDQLLSIDREIQVLALVFDHMNGASAAMPRHYPSEV
ncbi:MAG: hypothetical protein JSR72_03515 [Proteobacteria bacterium]|nr:hypothetical protein [Pseudomonadota bacterium]